jgi:hypothetical protein
VWPQLHGDDATVSAARPRLCQKWLHPAVVSGPHQIFDPEQLLQLSKTLASRGRRQLSDADAEDD